MWHSVVAKVPWRAAFSLGSKCVCGCSCESMRVCTRASTGFCGCSCESMPQALPAQCSRQVWQCRKAATPSTPTNSACMACAARRRLCSSPSASHRPRRARAATKTCASSDATERESACNAASTSPDATHSRCRCGTSHGRALACRARHKVSAVHPVVSLYPGAAGDVCARPSGSVARTHAWPQRQ
jgi:hypothetical protein